MEGFSAASNCLCPRETGAAHLDDGLAVQPVANDDVAMRLLRCVADGPGGLVKDFCGPEISSPTEAGNAVEGSAWNARTHGSNADPGKRGRSVSARF